MMVGQPITLRLLLAYFISPLHLLVVIFRITTEFCRTRLARN